MACGKQNYAAKPMTLAYRLESSRVKWEGISSLSADDITFLAKRPERPRDVAADYLRRTLDAGPKPSAQVFDEAASIEIAEMTLRRAVKDMGVKSYQHQRVWWLRLRG